MDSGLSSGLSLSLGGVEFGDVREGSLHIAALDK